MRRSRGVETSPVDLMDLGASIARAFDLAQAGRYEECESLCRSVLAIQPKESSSAHLLGLVCMQTGRSDEAVSWLEMAAAAHPDVSFIQANFALALAAQGRKAEAERRLRHAVALSPQDPAMHYNLATVLSGSDPAGAAREYGRTLDLDAHHVGARWNLSMIQLATGDWANGWANYRARFQVPMLEGLTAAYRNNPAPAWDGRPSDGKTTLLVYSEGGFGDFLMMVRYIPVVAGSGVQVKLLVPREMLRLAGSLPAQVIAFGDAPVVLPACDFKASLFDLPGLVGGSPGAAPPPYLQAPSELTTYWRSRLDALDRGHARLRIGIAWSGRPDNRVESLRQVPLELLGRLADRHSQGALFISLQKGDAAARQCAAANVRWPALADECADFADTAALMSCLDWIWSIDTSVANLAGALALDGAVMLHRPAEWRWGYSGDYSPWYPSLRLIRQQSPGDWNSVVDRLDKELHAKVARRENPQKDGAASTPPRA